MKFNWGTGIVTAFALFMGFILFFVFRVQSDSKYDNELVVEEYYKQERTLQAQLDKEQNAAGLEHKVLIVNQGGGIAISFPEELDYKKIKGKVSLYRPSDQKLDFEVPFSLSGHHLLIPKSDLAGGRWDITVDWQYDNKGYLVRQVLTL
ncbi:FixH family protein [Flavobacterium sp. MFBS3-15]|uniref:FixH family protein n=1 Tax=Flavobacterium sp. MFBS3-15 TaxID=2989816 RepID=UPI002236A481|nr:FixH family protein [Flavobacterium sp. MFBS3-15]MCW4469673.1 FixH family protein [Flavobacterium sp. MFBS3-15]